MHLPFVERKLCPLGLVYLILLRAVLCEQAVDSSMEEVVLPTWPELGNNEDMSGKKDASTTNGIPQSDYGR